jgi:hypothetical protein
VPFGPAFYRGFVDRVGGLPVDGEGTTLMVARPGPAQRPLPTRRKVAIGLWSGAAALGVAAAVTGGLAFDARSTYEATNLQRPADEARHAFAVDRTTAAVTAGTGAAAFVVGLVLYFKR